MKPNSIEYWAENPTTIKGETLSSWMIKTASLLSSGK